MPLYEYHCHSCDTRFERLEPVAAAGLHGCPRCGARAQRLLGVPALRFKGTGWYVTDYGKGSATGGVHAQTGSAPVAKASEGCHSAA
jgi:putative FmdB family regulatory protein